MCNVKANLQSLIAFKIMSGVFELSPSPSLANLHLTILNGSQERMLPI